jgi:hypothetical protein
MSKASELAEEIYRKAVYNCPGGAGPAMKIGVAVEIIQQWVEANYKDPDTYHAIVKKLSTAWEELREIREAIKADENESTADEVRSLVKQRDELLAALKELHAETAVDTDPVFDPKESFLRAHSIARTVLDKYKEATHVD